MVECSFTTQVFGGSNHVAINKLKITIFLNLSTGFTTS